ncbi:PR-1-like protein [Polychaeton citri CBS 116435]|uniref:PR-1-like protein n=1 Tax=Polychaeton citri CBS 116435 TaxID=1314669 RepID=A0A9P4UU83_9PEZI|nr:PR-1-like protein [Polychaeton citri CBS 116435]
MLFHSVAVLAWQRYETETELIVNTVIVETTTIWRHPQWFPPSSTFTTLARPSSATQPPAPPSSAAVEESSVAQTSFITSSVSTEQSIVAQHTDAPTSTYVEPAATSTGAIDPAWSGASFEKAVLNSTNTWRSQHDAAPLVWNDTLASFAKNHSGACIWEHTKDLIYGENLALGYQSAASAIDAWGNEEKDYSYSNAVFTESTGHFTQLVWKHTAQVGCGAVDCSNDGENGAKGWFFTCEYFPPGNYRGEFTINVVQSSDGGALSVGKRSEAVKAVAGRKTRALSLAGLVGAYWMH